MTGRGRSVTSSRGLPSVTSRGDLGGFAGPASRSNTAEEYRSSSARTKLSTVTGMVPPIAAYDVSTGFAQERHPSTIVAQLRAPGTKHQYATGLRMRREREWAYWCNRRELGVIMNA